MKKRFLTLLLASVMLVACGKQETKKEEVKQTEQKQQPTQKVEEKKEEKEKQQHLAEQQKANEEKRKKEEEQKQQNNIKAILKNQTKKCKGFAKIITTSIIFEEKNHKEILQYLDNLLKENGINYIVLSLDNGKDYYINTLSLIIEATFNQDFSVNEQKEFYMYKDGVYKTDDGKVLK